MRTHKWALASFVLMASGAVLTVSGCSSYESTYFTYDRDGRPTTTTVAGVPIVVNVPQKLGFLATESTYRIEGTASGDGTGPKGPPSFVTETTVDKTPIPLGASQLVNLDIKRPAYGTAKTNMSLSNQYPTTLSSDVNDLTLGRILDTVEKVVDKVEKEKQGESTRTLVSQRNFMIVYDPVTQQISRTRL